MSLSVHRVDTGQCTGKSPLVSDCSLLVMAAVSQSRQSGAMRIRGAVLEQIGLPRPYAESRPLAVHDLDLAPPGAGELLVRIEAAGVCHSDLWVVDGSRVRPVPMLLGHEAAGVVQQIGDGIDDVAVGDRVVMTFLPRGGECDGCRTDGRLPCTPGSAASNAGALLGGGIRLHRDA